MMAATSCMLPNSVTACCCSSCDDITHVPMGTRHDIIPLADALRDVISLNSHQRHDRHHLMSPSLCPTYRPSSPSPVGPAMGLRSHRTPSSQLQTLPLPFPPLHEGAPLSKASGAIPSGDHLQVSSSLHENEPPILSVPSKDLRYRGEGAEHIVLRILHSGQVLRLRKTSIGGPTISKGDLVIRAKKDEEFLHNVARPILGPLLTDEFSLVCLEGDTVQEMKEVLGPSRPAHRHHKEINNEGVAFLCPDAASIFISRHCPPMSSVPVYFTSSSVNLCIKPFLSSSQNSVENASSFQQNSSEQILCAMKDNGCKGLDVQVLPGVNDISQGISQEAKDGQNLRNTQTYLSTSTCSLHNTAIISLEGKYDSCDLPPSSEKLNGLNGRHLTNSFSDDEKLVSREPLNICIEIKPKQGFIDTSTPGMPLCRYCVKQYIKIGKETDKVTSRYCPLDLFSGDVTRMRKAVDGLLESPQNNLKVFVDGESVDNCLSFRYLCDVIIAALTYDFMTGRAGLQENGTLSQWSPLGRTLAFQTLDKLGVFNAFKLYNHLVEIVGQAKAADELLQDLRCWTGNTYFCQSEDKLCTRCTLDDPWQIDSSPNTHYGSSSISNTQQDRLSEKENSHEICSDNLHNFEESEAVTLSSEVQKDCITQSNLRNVSKSKIMKDSTMALTKEDLVRKLQEYLLSTTAKDLSLMILLSGPHKSTPVPRNTANSSPFIIELEPGVWFRCQVTGVDLVAKPPSKILKHEQDYMSLKAVLEELKRQGREPACCKL